MTHAFHRVEIGAEVTIDDFLGYIEYPSHTPGVSTGSWAWHTEQRSFVRAHGLASLGVRIVPTQ